MANISIHAPVKGATTGRRRAASPDRHFNPRTREGCDGTLSSVTRHMITYFNPRTREGCDIQNIKDGLLRQSFQSTHP